MCICGGEGCSECGPGIAYENNLHVEEGGVFKEGKPVCALCGQVVTSYFQRKSDQKTNNLIVHRSCYEKTERLQVDNELKIPVLIGFIGDRNPEQTYKTLIAIRILSCHGIRFDYGGGLDDMHTLYRTPFLRDSDGGGYFGLKEINCFAKKHDSDPDILKDFESPFLANDLTDELINGIESNGQETPARLSGAAAQPPGCGGCDLLQGLLSL